MHSQLPFLLRLREKYEWRGKPAPSGMEMMLRDLGTIKAMLFGMTISSGARRQRSAELAWSRSLVKKPGRFDSVCAS
jgi:hypothetical protein